MIQQISKRLIACFLAFLLCFTLPSCGVVSTVKDALSTLTDKPSDFDRYIEYLNRLEDHEDVYDGYGYLAMAYPVRVQDELCINLAGVCFFFKTTDLKVLSLPSFRWAPPTHGCVGADGLEKEANITETIIVWLTKRSSSR